MSESRIVFTAEEQAALLPLEPDTIPLEPDEVEGKTLFTLISPGTEMNLYLGNYHRRGLDWGKFPCSPGYAAVFRAQQVGRDVADISPGDLVFCMGRHQSRQRVKRREAIPAPEGMKPQLVPFARLMNVTMSSLTDTASRPPAKVAVTGLGAIGLLGAQIFARCGYDVLAVDPLEERRQAALAAGLRDVREALPLEDPAYAGKVAMLLECASVEQAVLEGCKLLQKGGEILLVGTQMVRCSDLTAQELLYHVFRGGVSIRGGSEWRIPLHGEDYRQNSCYGNMAAALDWLADGSVTVEGLYETASPAAAQEVYQKVLHRQTARLCTLFDWAAL